MNKRAAAKSGSVYVWKRNGVQVGWTGAADITGADGKRKRQVVYAKTQAEARRRLNEVLSQHQAGTLPTSGRLTVRAWLEIWLKRQRAESGPAPSTITSSTCVYT